MNKELEELKAKWIIEEKEFNEKNLGRYVKRLIPLCKITRSSEVVLTDRGQVLSLKDKVKLALVARLIAHRLDASIPEEISANEISEFFLVDKLQVNARLKEVTDERFAIRERKGVYKVNIGRIEKFFEEIEKKHGSGK